MGLFCCPSVKQFYPFYLNIMNQMMMHDQGIRCTKEIESRSSCDRLITLITFMNNSS